MPDYLTTLDRNALTENGISGWSYGYQDKVRFYELDALNHVNNVVYLRWFETIRVAYAVDYGLTTYASDDDPQLVVRRVSADYHAPMFQHQSYTVTARTRLVKASSLIMEYTVFVDEKIVATGEAVVVSLTPDGTARQPFKPAAVQNMLTRDLAEQG